MNRTRGDIIDDIVRLFRERGDSDYGGEPVSQRAHALQAAYLARRAHAGPHLVAAALLHDVGHLLHDLPSDAPDRGHDDRHEQLGGEWLARWFGPEVVEPVRLHVAAKRFLCGAQGDYGAQLSEPSRVSLRLQGGPMSAEECEQFRALRHFHGAVELRRWDDAAKIPGLCVPGIEAYADDLAEALGSTLHQGT